MAKIAEILFLNNSLREIISGVIPTNTNGILKKTKKGAAIYFDNTADLDGYGIFSNVKTIIFAIKPSDNTKIFLDNGTDKLGISGGNYSGTGLTENTVFIDSEVDTDAATYNCWQLVISEFSAGINFATDLEIAPTANIYLGYRIILYDHILSQEEKNELYIDFLAQKPLGQKKQNFYYPKPTDLSRIDGISSAYNMIPGAGAVLVDISDNGKNGTITGALQFKDGIRLDGVDDVIETTEDLSGLTECTIMARMKRPDTTKRLAISQAVDTSNRIKILIYSDGKVYAVMSNGTPKAGSYIFNPVNTNNYAFVFNGAGATNADKLKLYINGEEVTLTYSGDIASSVATMANNLKIGYEDDATAYSEGEIQDVRIYRKACSEAEIKEYHNEYAKQISFIDDFSLEPADKTSMYPKDWFVITGTYRILELTADDSVLKSLKAGHKVINNISNNTILGFQNNIAYGAFEITFRKNAGQNLYLIPITDRKNLNPYAVHFNGYMIRLSSGGNFSLVRVTSAGSYVTLIDGGTIISSRIFYTILLERKINGEFKVYIKGGSFGDVFTLIGTSTNNDITQSKYSCFRKGSGSFLTNIKYTKGIKQ